MSYTTTRTQTDTYTESRAIAVMDQVLEDLFALVIAKSTNITKEKALKWREDILKLMELKVLNWFEVQVFLSDGSERAIRYFLRSDGKALASDGGGGIDWYAIPFGSKVSLLLNYKTASQDAKDYLSRRNYGTGSPIGGDEHYDRTLSKDNFGLDRNYVNWK